MQKKQNFKELAMVCFGLLFSLASLADAHPDFSAICKNWNAVTAKIYDVRFECAETNQALNTARSYLAFVDEAFPFTAKAPTLEVMEFESDEEFKARVRKQSDEDAKALEQVTKMREEAKKYLVDSIEQLAGKAIGIAARFLQALNGGPAINQVDIAKIEHVDTDDEISHAPITGREFLVYIKDCPVEYRGPELKDMTVEWVDSN